MRNHTSSLAILLLLAPAALFAATGERLRVPNLWDALTLAGLVKPGTPVLFRE
jgi:hypothetical protein